MVTITLLQLPYNGSHQSSRDVLYRRFLFAFHYCCYRYVDRLGKPKRSDCSPRSSCRQLPHYNRQHYEGVRRL